MTLDGTTQTVGIDQQTDPGTVQVLYNDKNRFVAFTADPGSAHTLKVFGAATIPIVAHKSDPVGIATYGEFQDVIVDSKISTIVEAQQRAQAEILQFGHAVYDVKFNTLVPGCTIGQTIIINSPKLGIANYPLVIKRVEATVFVPGTQGKLEYQIEAIGSDTVTFVDLMTTLLQQEATHDKRRKCSDRHDKTNRKRRHIQLWGYFRHLESFKHVDARRLGKLLARTDE